MLLANEDEFTIAAERPLKLRKDFSYLDFMPTSIDSQIKLQPERLALQRMKPLSLNIEISSRIFWRKLFAAG
jgi:hypothetical protein